MNLEHRDIEGWLATKLEEPWSSEKLSSLLTRDILQFILLKFTKIDTAIRIKVLFSFLFLKKKQYVELESTIQMLLQIATEEEDDEWIKILGQLLLKIGEEKIMVNLDLDPFNENIKRINNTIDKLGPPKFFPLENLYLNENVLSKAESNTLNNHNHFKLKKPLTELQVFSKKPSTTGNTPSLSGAKLTGLSSPMNIDSTGTSTETNPLNNNDTSMYNGFALESPTLKNEKLKLQSSGLNPPIRKSTSLFIPKAHHSDQSMGGNLLQSSSSGINSSGNSIGIGLNSSSNTSPQPNLLHHLNSSTDKRGVKKVGMRFIDIEEVKTNQTNQTNQKKRRHSIEPNNNNNNNTNEGEEESKKTTDDKKDKKKSTTKEKKERKDKKDKEPKEKKERNSTKPRSTKKSKSTVESDISSSELIGLKDSTLGTTSPIMLSNQTTTTTTATNNTTSTMNNMSKDELSALSSLMSVVDQTNPIAVDSSPIKPSQPPIQPLDQQYILNRPMYNQPLQFNNQSPPQQHHNYQQQQQQQQNYRQNYSQQQSYPYSQQQQQQQQQQYNPYSQQQPQNYQPQQSISNPQQQQPPQQKIDNSNIAANSQLLSLLETANLITPENKVLLERFLNGDLTNPTPQDGNLKQVPLLVEKMTNENGENTEDTVVIEINFETGVWRKIRRRKKIKK